MSENAAELRAGLELLAADFTGRKRAAQDLSARSPALLLALSQLALAAAKDSATARQLLALLGSRGLVPAVLDLLADQDPGIAGVVGELARRLDPSVAAALRANAGAPPPAPPQLNPARWLDLLAASFLLLPMAESCAASPDARLRARAALILGHAVHTQPLWQALLADPNPRVRANAVESLWRGTAPAARDVFRAATRDPSARVAANAWVGLYLAGEAESVAGLHQMSTHDEPAWRASAVWAMGRTGDGRFRPLLRRILRGAHHEAGLKRNIMLALSRLDTAAALARRGPAEVTICRAAASSDGPWEIEFFLDSQRAGAAAPALRATDVQPHFGDLPVWDYTFTAVVTPAPRRVRLLLPLPPVSAEAWRSGLATHFAPVFQAGLGPALESWGVDWYLTAPPAAPAVAALDPGAASPPPAEYADSGVPVAPLLADAGALQRALAQPVWRPEVPIGVAALLHSAIAGLRAEAGSRHLILAAADLTETLLPAALLPPAVADLRAAGVLLHVAAAPGHPPAVAATLRSLAEASGGSFLLAPAPDALPLTLAALAAALRSRYRISFAAPPAAQPAAFRLHLDSAVLRAQATAAWPERAFTAQQAS